MIRETVPQTALHHSLNRCFHWIQPLLLGALVALWIVPAGGDDFILLEPLNGIAGEARLSGDADGVEAANGRIGDRSSLLLRDARAQWHIEGADNCYVEFWLRPVDWSGDAAAGTDIASFVVGSDHWLLRKPEDDSQLILEKNGEAVQSYPIYNWRERSWMGDGDDDSRWHYLWFALEDGHAYLSVNGFSALPSGGAAARGQLTSVALGGQLGSLFSELHVVPGTLTQREARARYRDLYRGLPSIDPNTVTVPWVEHAPATDGQIDGPAYGQMATLLGFVHNGRSPRTQNVVIESPLGSLEGSGIHGYLGYDADNMYLTIVTPYLGELDFVAEDRSNLSRRESYEIFICPPWTGTPDYVQLLGNPHGDKMDLRGMDTTWSGHWYWETAVGEGDWTGELRLPFAGVDFPHPGDREVWSMNLFNTHARAAWSPSQRYHDTGAFGILRFDRNAPVIRPQSLVIDGGRVQVDMELLGRGIARDITVGMSVYGPEDMLPAVSRIVRLNLGAGDSWREVLELELGDLESGNLVLFVREDGTTLFSQNVGFPTAERVVRQAHLRDDERPAPQLAEVTAVEERELTTEELAYARRWTAEELGEELLQMNQWWDNDLGRDKRVPGPWVPMEVSDGREVVTFGQRYIYDDTLFPAQIFSAGEALFARPPELVLQTEAGDFVFSKADHVNIEQLNDSEVRVRTVGRQGPFELSLDTLYEFDGMGTVHFNLRRDGESIIIQDARLRFVMPPARSGLFHYSAGWGGHPPATDAGALPADGITLNQFREILWLGDHYRGFTWFADRIEGWKLLNENGIQRLYTDKSGDRVMEIKLADRSFELSAPWAFVFGIQATPTREVIENRRIVADRNKAMLWMWNWGDGNSYYPFFDDPEPARAHVERMRAQGRELMPASSQRFYRRYRSFRNHYGEVKDPGLQHRELLLWGPLWRQLAYAPEPSAIPERHTAGGRWYGDRNTEPRELTGLCAASPFQDYFLWRLNQTIEDTGLGAFYLDQPLGVCGNALHGCGYIDYKGDWRPSGLVFARREFQKRMYKMFYDKHGFTRIKWHSSNHIIIPAISFTDIFFDGENYGHSDLKVYEFYSDVLNPGRMQAQHTGLPFGFAPALLPTLEERYSPTAATVSDMMGYFMVHDSHVRPIRSQQNALGNLLNALWFEFPFEESTQYYYWENYDGLDVGPDDLFYIVHTTADDCMVILFNPQNSPMNAALRMDGKALGMGVDVTSLRDAEHGTVFTADADGSFNIVLSPRDTRILRLSQ